VPPFEPVDPPVSYRSADAFRPLRDDRPSTGPLGRSEKAELVSGSSSALLRRRRVSVGWLADSRGWLATPRGWVVDSRGWLVDSRGWLVDSRGWVATPRGGVADSRGRLPAPGWLAALIGWLLLGATRTGCVAPGRGGFMLWTGCVAA
jgi:hypothetical protein